MVSNANLNEERLQQDDILLNGEILTKGFFQIDIIGKIYEDNIGQNKQDISIKGLLKTKYYMKEIDKIESIRYYVDGVFVTKESYDSSNDMITYEFNADFFKPKFQDTDYERV